MGTSFFDQHNMSVPSLNSSRDNGYEMDERFVGRSSSQQPQRRKSKRSSTKKERHDIVRNSLEQFLVDGQLEDFVLFDEKQQKAQERRRSNSRAKPNEDIDSTTDSYASMDLFDRNVSEILAAVGKSSRRQSRSKKRKGTRKPKKQQQPPQSEDEQSLSDSKIFQTSLNKPFDGHQSEGSLSLSDLKMDKSFNNDTPKRRSRRPSVGSYSQLKAGVRPRSQIGTANLSDSALNNRKNNDLVRGLNTLDRQVRRDRMKKEYRTPSVDIRSVGGSTSKGSTSTTSTGSRSLSYKRTGFEGGALNAIMGNESFAKIASNGGDIASLSGSATFNSSRSDAEFRKVRKARQDKILEMIARENSLHDKARDEFKEQQSKSQNMDLDSTSFSQEVGKKKKDHLVKKMKKAARKTAKMSKSGARVAANAVVGSSKQRTARKGYEPAPELPETEEEQPLQMEKTPTHSNKKKARSSAKSSTSKRSSKSQKGKETKSTSFESFDSSPFTSPTPKKPKQAKESSAKSFNSFVSFDTASPFKSKHGRTKARATTNIKPKISRGLNDSMSGNFPDFQLAENSKVIWWDL